MILDLLALAAFFILAPIALVIGIWLLYVCTVYVLIPLVVIAAISLILYSKLEPAPHPHTPTSHQAEHTHEAKPQPFGIDAKLQQWLAK